MVTLSYQDLLEWLGYATTDRHPLEILGYEYSTRGARQFRGERPDFLPQVCRIIEASLEEAGAFPRAPGPGVLEDGAYLERRPGGTIALHRNVEVGMSQTARVRTDFATARAAALELVRQLIDPAYLPGSAP
jgi:hypothetical protein